MINSSVLDIMMNDALQPEALSTTQPSDTTTIFTAKRDCTVNMMIQTISFDFIRTSLLFFFSENEKYTTRTNSAKDKKWSH